MTSPLPIRSASVAVIALLSAAGAAGADETTPIVIGQRTTIHSSTLDEDRPIRIALPAGYEEGDLSYPVLYVLDGRFQFAHVAAIAEALAFRGHIPPLIVVGVENTDRSRDMTPPGVASVSGGGDEFLEFIVEELAPYVAANYRASDFRALWGHSRSAMLAVHALARRPHDFHAVLAASPGLGFGDGMVIAGAERSLAEHPDLDRSLYVTVGDEPGPQREAFDAFVEMLRDRAPDAFRWKQGVFLDDDHGTVVLRTTDYGLRFVFEPYRLSPEVLEAEGLAAIQRHMRVTQARYGNAARPREGALNDHGYRALGAGNVDAAIELFKLNVELYPRSSNVYDSLGEALERKGQVAAAARNYARAVELAEASGSENLELFRANLARVTAAPDPD